MPSARVTQNADKAAAALAALQRARTNAQRLAAAQALESAACQLRRALKADIATKGARQ